MGPPMDDLPNEALDQVAAYFQAPSAPTRWHSLSLLRGGARNVGELGQLCAPTCANLARHLAVLRKHGVVARENRGTSVDSRIADESVYALCDLACGSIVRQFEQSARECQAFLQTVSRTKGKSK